MRRWLLGAAVGIVLLLGCAGAALWLGRVEVFAWAAGRLLERQGLGPATFTVDSVDLSGLTAHDVSLAGGTLRADKLAFAFVPRELAAGHLGSLEIGGLALTLGLGKEGLTFGGRTVATQSGGPSALAGLRIDSLLLREAHVTVDGAGGRTQATVSATLSIANGEVQGSAVTANLTGPLLGAARGVTIAADSLRIQPQPDGGAKLAIAKATLSPQSLPWLVQALDGELAWQPDRATIRISTARLVNRQKPLLVQPLTLHADATLTGSRLDFSLSGDAGGKAAAKLQAKGRHDLASGKGSASLAFGPVLFKRGGPQPVDLFPAAAGTAPELDGSVGVSGTLAWSARGLAPDLTLSLKNVALSLPGAEVSALAGDIKFSGFQPPATPPGQVLKATVQAPGLPPSALTLKGQLLAGPALNVEQAAFALAGGDFATTPFRLDPSAPEVDTTLQVDHVDLAEITRLLGIDGLSGTGRLDGKIPLALHGGKLAIAGGKLAAREPGLINYRPSTLPPEIAGAGSSVELALQALSDFHYDQLSLDLDKDASGEGTVLLHIEGNNPAFMSGQVFHFNVRLDSNFDRLADLALLSLRSAEDLLRRAARKPAQ